MFENIENYVKNVSDLYMLEAKNIPIKILKDMSKLCPNELFKLSSQIYILLNNIPSKERLLNLNEEEISKGATEYIKSLVERMKKIHENQK